MHACILSVCRCQWLYCGVCHEEIEDDEEEHGEHRASGGRLPGQGTVLVEALIVRSHAPQAPPLRIVVFRFARSATAAAAGADEGRCVVRLFPFDLPLILSLSLSLSHR